jgi:hypothetical protein
MSWRRSLWHYKRIGLYRYRRLLRREFCTDGRNHACFGNKRYRALRVEAELKIDFIEFVVGRDG